MQSIAVLAGKVRNVEKQRQAMQEYRSRIAAEKKAEKEAAQKEEAKRRKQQEANRRKREKARILQAAEQGDALARMILAARESGNRSPEYWEAYKDYDIEYAAKFGKKSTTTVNGISVHNPEFGLAVSISIEETGSIYVEIGRRS